MLQECQQHLFMYQISTLVKKSDDRVHIHDDVKQQLISDARHVVSNLANGVAHGILVTGDIAHSGTKAEYDSAGEWLDELASSIGAEIHCVQMVPGNHDLIMFPSCRYPETLFLTISVKVVPKNMNEL